MIYVFYALMGISALVAVVSFLGVIAALLGATTGYHDDGDKALNGFILSAILFCIAAICVQLWVGFPS